MNYKELLAAALKRAGELSKAASERDLTEDELAEAKTVHDNVVEYKAKVKAAEDCAALVKELGDLGKETYGPDADQGGEQPAKSLGEHFVKHAGKRLAEIRGVKGASVSAPEFGLKASSDTQKIPSSTSVVTTEIDTNIVTGLRRRLTIADLLGSGTLSGNAITYFVEGALEGDFTTVAEAGSKPQLHYADPTTVTESLKKIAGFVKLSDEMMEDLPFLVSEINGRLLYNLGLFEENQLFDGNGTGTNIKGVVNRTGVQSESATSTSDNADAIFRAMTKVSTETGLDADGIVINPTDYQNLRLSKDSNGQYFGGGFFAGEYGNGGITMQPPLWGLRTVVTPAATAGTVVVGAWAQGGTVYRKGGVRVESTNSHDTDFTSNLVTVRAEERLALAVRYPKAFVKVTLSDES